MIKACYIACVLIFLFRPHLYSIHALPGRAQSDKNGPADISLQTGFLYGNLGEYVYSGNRTVSKLSWDIKPLVYTGPSLLINYDNISCGIGYWINVNTEAGSVSDTDWNETGAKTRVSRHDCAIISARFFDANAGYSLYKTSAGRIYLYAGYSFKQIILEASGGYVENPSTGERFNATGIFIQYEQAYHIPYIAASWIFNFNPEIFFSAAGLFSNFVFCNAVDNHVTRELEFRDHIEWGRYYSLSALASLRTGRSCALALSAGFSAVEKKRGDTYWINSQTCEKSGVYKNAAGISFKAWEMMISASYTPEWE